MSLVVHAFGFGSGPVVVTSDNTVSGSALVWVIWAANRNGDGGELRAYDPVPVNGALHERYHYPIGQATSYSTPGVGGGKLYVGTRDGKVLAFGSPVSQPLTGSGASFPATIVGQSSQQTLTLTANANISILSANSNSSQFTLGTATPAIPTSLAKGATISIPVTFTPTSAGLKGGQVTISTSAGSEAFSVSGTGQTAPPQLASDKKLLTLPGIAVGGHISGTVTFSNIGSQTLTISAVHPPAAPFTLSGAPAAGTQIAPNGSITITVNFDPTTGGTYNDAVGLDSDGGNLSVGLSGTASTQGQLQISPLSTDYGNVVVGDSVSNAFTVKNVGGTTVTINKSKPPFGGAFTNTSTLDEGTTIQPGETLTESVTFAPTATGAASGTWQITGDDSTGLHQVQFTGTGISTLSGPGLTFGTTTLGQSSGPQTLTVTTNTPLTVQAVGTTGPFAAGTSTPTLPATLAKGATISIPLTYSPTAAGPQSGEMSVTTSAGSQSFSLSGTGQLPAPKLTAAQSSVAFGTTDAGTPIMKAVTFSNTGAQPLTISAVHAPAAPFTLSSAPTAGTTIAPNGSITINVTFDRTTPGTYTGAIGLDSDGGNVSVSTSGSVRRPTVKVPAAPKLLPAIVTTTQLSSMYISYAATAVANAKFTLQHETGGRLKQVTHGRKVTRSCMPASGHVPQSDRCTRYITVATFHHRDRVGSNRIRVTSDVSWRKLVPGIYRLSSVLFDTDGVKHTFRATFRVRLPPARTAPPKHGHRR